MLLADSDRNLIAKFASTTDIRPVVKAEGVAMELARRAGLNVAPTQVTQVADKDVLLVERFDRPGDGRRRHLVSALTIVGLDEFADARYGSYALLADHIRQTFLLDTSQAQSIIDGQIDVIQTQWRDAADAARLSELERQQLFRREILNEFAFQN